ncbi:hypothetical protein JWV26_08635 [Ectopseudomonas toyotomiensis]|uniref:WYL domain-containing protein n=1 Tax=Ectopseudomonas toyotomiensis TaxID=554344 RepID=A0ABD7E374_9GAMM|nr:MULTISPECIES: hypothetical protein [Pseudomonas]QSL94407.1 hypothetical protein JWV26_08635 [Pseudomonas toyotomiensis]RRV22615.1 hypothetical protein EGJ23_19800 [Pseudomonas sp. o96-267]
MREILAQAINERRYIAFTYSGLQREAQPAAVGISHAGNPVLRCYQTAGGHITPGHEWDFCELSKIVGLKVLDKTFSSNPPSYKKGDKGMSQIFAEL